jgi:hypothetical protein
VLAGQEVASANRSIQRQNGLDAGTSAKMPEQEGIGGLPVAVQRIQAICSRVTEAEGQNFLLGKSEQAYPGAFPPHDSASQKRSM